MKERVLNQDIVQYIGGNIREAGYTKMGGSQL